MSNDLAVLETASAPNLFRASSPAEVIAAAEEMAAPLGRLIREKQMVTRIAGTEHTNIEGWQTAGAMLGISAHTVWSRPCDPADLAEDPTGRPVIGWEARAEARTRAGEVVGAAEGMVTSTERNWRNASDQAMRSMAQTRAQSKALGSALRFVMAMTGLKGTPVEEVEESEPAALPNWARPADPAQFVASVRVLLAELVGHDEAVISANAVGRNLYEACGGVIPMAGWAAVSMMLDQVAQARSVAGATAEEHDAPVPEPGEQELVDRATEEFDAIEDDPGDLGDVETVTDPPSGSLEPTEGSPATPSTPETASADENASEKTISEDDTTTPEED
jgi:hypothetical protein